MASVYNADHKYNFLFRLGTQYGYRFLVLDLLGPSLEDLLNYCGGQFTQKTVLMLADQMIMRIQYLHERNYIHRDIKPANFLMGKDQSCNQVHLIDFGLAKHVMRNVDITAAGTIFGTPFYISPEQGHGDDQAGATKGGHGEASRWRQAPANPQVEPPDAMGVRALDDFVRVRGLDSGRALHDG